MESLAPALLYGSVAVLGMMVAAWSASVTRRDASIVDLFWGLGFVLFAWIARYQGPPASPRAILLLTLVTIWGLRLSVYIGLRNHGRGEDRRYRAMREARGASFWWQSLFSVFLLQGALIVLLSLPLLVVQARPLDPAWRWTDLLGTLLWVVGFVYEAGGDWQLSRFKADPANRGKVLRHGLWATTRHPNYFGDALQWWGFWVIGLGAPGGWWTVVSPLLMTWLLLRVSGVTLLESTIGDRRPGYREYAERTNAFFPWWPKRARAGDDRRP